MSSNSLKKILIYIPSYNRYEALMQQLITISKSIVNLSRVRVIVSDNSSTDKRYENVKLFCNNNGIEYIKNYSNIGMIPNAMKGFLYSDASEYIWVVSDDDFLKEDSISKILNIIKNNIDVLWLKKNAQDKLIVKDATIIDNIDSVLKEDIALITAVIYKSSFIKESLFCTYEASLTYVPHFAMLLHAINIHENVSIGIVGQNNFFTMGSVEQEDGSLRSPKMLFGFPYIYEYANKKLGNQFLVEITDFFYVRHYVKADRSFYGTNKEFDLLSDFCFGYLSRRVRFYSLKYYTWKIIFPLYKYFVNILNIKTKEKILKLIRIFN